MKTTIHDDNRGSHTKFFTRASADAYGFNDVTEVFMTTNRKGTLRGLHRQFGEGQLGADPAYRLDGCRESAGYHAHQRQQ